MIPEMGGVALAAGFGSAILLALALVRFAGWGHSLNVSTLLAVLAVSLIAALIGLIDDLLSLGQTTKAFLPFLAALPLAAIRAGVTEMVIPLYGPIDVGWAYPLILVPIGVTVAANASNMLAGFNGLELGIGIVQMGSLAILAGVLGEAGALLILLAGLGALLGALRFNWFPARVFIGDVGTLTIGTIIASAVIVGNFEVAGVVVFLPHTVDFILKARHRFPTDGWGGKLGEDGRLRCPRPSPSSLPQLLLKAGSGLRERSLVLLLIGIEATLGLAAVLLYVLKRA
jgi:UDP-N-acetylglucosamine--dolichyl-phosphate N-acetylglucosaminephosphotransferase